MKQKSADKSNQRNAPLNILQSPILDSQFETNSADDDYDEDNIPESLRGLLEAVNTPFQFIFHKSKAEKESNNHVTQFITLGDQSDKQIMNNHASRMNKNEHNIHSNQNTNMQKFNQQRLQNKTPSENKANQNAQTQKPNEFHLTDDIQEEIKFKYIEKKSLSDNQSISIEDQTLLAQQLGLQDVSQIFSLHEEFKDHIDLEQYKRKKQKKKGDNVKGAGLPQKNKDQKVSKISSQSSQKMFIQEAQLYGTNGRIPSQVQNLQSPQFLRYSTTNQDIEETTKLQNLLAIQEAGMLDNTRNNQILKLGCQTSPSPEHHNHPSRYRPNNKISPEGIFIQQTRIEEEEEKHLSIVQPSASRGFYNGQHNSKLQLPPQVNQRKESVYRILSHRQIGQTKGPQHYDEFLTPYKNEITGVSKRKLSQRLHEETKNETSNKKKQKQSTKKNLDYKSHLNIPHSKVSDPLLDDDSKEEIQSLFGKVLFDKIRENTASAKGDHQKHYIDKRNGNQSQEKRILVESSISDSEQLSSNSKNEIEKNQLSSVGQTSSYAHKQRNLLQVPSLFLAPNSFKQQKRGNTQQASFEKSITQRHSQSRRDNQANQMAQIFEIVKSGTKVQKNFPKESSFFYFTENRKQKPAIKHSMVNNNHIPISLGFYERQEKNKSAKDLNVLHNKKKFSGAPLNYQEQDSQFNKFIKSFQIMNELNNEGRQSKDQLLKKTPSADRFSRTNYGGEDPSNVNDISATEFNSHYEKGPKGGALFVKKRQSKSLNGDDDFKDNFEENLPVEFNGQEEQEGDWDGGEPQTVVPEETPMQRLIKALKQARAEKEARERAEALRVAQGKDALQKQCTMSADSALVNASIERRCFNLINPEKFIIHPHDKFKGFWDILITLLIIITCMYAPYTLAFQMSANSTALLSIDTFINVIFLGDIMVNMISAYQDNDFNIVTDHKVIIKKYLLSWFIIDVLSIIPIDLMLGITFQDDSTQLTSDNYTKLSRLNRLFRLFRMVRLLKMLHVDNMYLRKFADFLDIGSGSERLIFLTLILLLLQHVVACIWIFIAKYDSVHKENWIFKTGYTDAGDLELYVTSFYFTVTTIMTVGYGDITPDSVSEKIITVMLMLIGVVLFSYATGSISSIISSADSEDARLKEKMSTLKDLQGDYDLEVGLFNKIAKALQYGNQHAKGVVEFMDELPTKLRIELAMAIHKKMYSNIKFFKDKDKSFIVWVGTLLKPMNVQTDDFIYKDYEYITEIYFLVKGKAGYVLPKYPSQVYIEIEQGELFGHTDLAYNKAFFKYQKNFKKALNKNKDDMRRNFTVRVQDSCDILTLSMDDLEKMMLEFPDVYYELMNDASETLAKHEKIKFDEIQRIEIEKAKQKSQLNSNISSVFMNRFIKKKTLIAESSQPHQSNFHPRGGGQPNIKKMKKTGGYRFKNQTFNNLPQPNQQVGLGDSNDNLIAMTFSKPTSIPNMLHGIAGVNSIGQQSQFNETAGFGDQSVKLDNNNMKQMISTGTPRADREIRGKYESSRKVVSFKGKNPNKIESNNTLGFNNNFNSNSNNPPLINNNSQLNNQRVEGDTNGPQQDAAIGSFQGEGSSIANNQQLQEAARTLNLTVNNNTGVTGAGEANNNNNQSAAQLLNNLDQAPAQQAQNQSQQPEETQNSQQDDVDYGSNYNNQGEDQSEDSEVDSDEELRQMKNMMYSLASRVDMMHREQRQILRILMLQAQNNNGNSANGAPTMFAPSTLQVPQSPIMKKNANQPQQPLQNPPISPQQFAKFAGGPGSGIRNIKQMKPK